MMGIMETELKLLLDPADVADFRGHPLLKQHAIAKPRLQQLTSRYFDTPDLHFRRHDAALRVRRVGRSWVQTLKAGGQVAAGLYQRQEWESRVDGPHPDLAALIALVGRGSAWAKVLSAQALADRLVPVFTTRVRRTIWLLRLAHGEEVELALDQGKVQHGAAQLPISEIELELKSGDPARLFDFTLALQEAVPLRVGNISKAERGYALYAPQPPAVVEAAHLELAAGLTVEQGFQAIVGNCLAQIQGNEAGVAQGSDPESVHQMRVGLRRLRSALGLFGEVAPCPAALQEELGWLASALGATRDWEVFAGGTLNQVAGARPDEAEWAPLQQAAFDVARKNRQKAAASVRSVRYARLLLSLGGWVQGARWRESLAQPGREALAALLATFATQTLARRHGTLKKRGKRLQEGTPQARHRVRIAAKNVRYAAEFFHSLYPAKRLRPYVAALAALQDALGWLNDASVADGLLRQLAQTCPDLAHSAGFARGYLSVRAERDVRKLGKRWQRFACLKHLGGR
jgi:triphosphatase